MVRSILVFYFYLIDMSQSAFTCSKSTMKTPEQCVKSVQSKQ